MLLREGTTDHPSAMQVVLLIVLVADVFLPSHDSSAAGLSTLTRAAQAWLVGLVAHSIVSAMVLILFVALIENNFNSFLLPRRSNCQPTSALDPTETYPC